MSTLEANTVKPISGSSTLTLGESGDTVSLGTGVTAGTGIGTTINNNADNRIITGSGTANTLEGESNLTYSSPDLTVTGGNPSIIHNNTTAGGDTGIKFQGSGIDYGFINLDNSDGALDLGTSVGWSTRFYTNNSERMRIDSAGAVKCNSRLIIDNDGNSSYKLNAEFGGSSESGAYMNDKDGANNATYFNFRRQGTEIGNIIRNGTNDAVAYNTSSDYRLKDGIVDKTDGIEKIKQLKPRKFYWKSNEDKTLVDGFVAHEVSDIVPEAITGEKDATETYIDDNGDEQTRIKPQAIDQSKLVPLLTSALQEAITKIETLEAKVAALESA